MDMVPLKAAARDAKAKASVLRRSGQVPAVVYGHKVQLAVQCPAQELRNAFRKAGESTLVELDVEGKKIPVLFKSVDFDPISDREIHVDFYAVNMDEEIETLVPVHFEGEPLAVKNLGGVFVIVHDHVKVRCLPARLPHSILVSVSGLEAFHMSVAIKDLQVPAGVQLMEAGDTVLATVQEPRKEEEIVVAAPVPAEGEAAAAEGAVAEGAPAPEGAAKEGAAKEAQGKEKEEKETKEKAHSTGSGQGAKEAKAKK